MTTTVPVPQSATGSATNPISSASSAPFTSASLYVGDLSGDVTEALLFEIFNAVGPVASVRVCRDSATRRSLGYAYVNYHRVEDAERALDTMNFKSIKTRPCRIMWSHRDPALRKSGHGNIFVNHLEKSIDNKSLYDTFSMFGNILSCKVATNKDGSLGYGFVHYESEESAQKAINRVDGKIIAGSKVSVTMFKSKSERGGTSKARFTNVYVKNLPIDWSEQKLNEVFGKFGTITSAKIAEVGKDGKEKDGKDGKNKGFGFINYANPEEAAAAVAGLHEFEVDGKKLYVSRAQKKEERERELRDQFDLMKQDRQRKYANVNCYVKNLADDVDDDKLRSVFAGFGSITSAKVMRDASNKSRGFGFVCFATPEEAARAVADKNGQMFEGKPLYVSLAQRKDQRRAALEAHYQVRQKMAAGGNVGGMYPSQMLYQGPTPGGVMAGPRGPFMYPPQGMGMRPRWNGQGIPMMSGGPGQVPINYQLMPMGRGGPGGPAPRGRGGRGGGRGGDFGRGGGRGGVGPAGAGGRGGQPHGGQPQYKYNDNVRNRNQPPQQAPASPQAAPQSPLPADAVVAATAQQHEPLTIKALAGAPEEQRKQMIGERLYPLIEAVEPAQAGKITGMLLEMDTPELIHLLESQQALSDKIQEAIMVLHSNPQDE